MIIHKNIIRVISYLQILRLIIKVTNITPVKVTLRPSSDCNITITLS